MKLVHWPVMSRLIRYVQQGDGSIKVFRPTRHTIGHFRDVLPSQSLGLVGYCKTKSITTKANTHLYQNILQHKMNIKSKRVRN